MIYDLTRGYDVAYTLQQGVAFFRGRGFNRDALGALLVLSDCSDFCAQNSDGCVQDLRTRCG